MVQLGIPSVSYQSILIKSVSKMQPGNISCCMSCVEAVQTCLSASAADVASDNYIGTPVGNDIHDPTHSHLLTQPHSLHHRLYPSSETYIYLIC